MANERISDLPNLGAVASDDEIAIVDVSAGATKKATIANAVGDYGNTVYPRLSANNTMTGLNTFEQALTIEFDTGNMLRLQNTDWGGTYVRVGQNDGGEGVLQLPSGLQYVFSESGNEVGSSALRRAYADTRYTQSSSDESKKENIEDLQGSGDIIDGLMPRNFTWIPNEDDPKPEGVMTGLIAQEVEQVLPGAVLGSDGNKGLDALSLIGVVVAELKSLRARVAELEGEQ